MPTVYKVNDGENIYDVVLATYGRLEYVYKLILENPQLQDIDVSLPLLPGLQLIYDDTFKLPEEQRENRVQPSPPSREYIIQEGQSVYDVALMVYGSVEMVYQLLQDNKDLLPSINQGTLGGMKLKFDSTLNDNLVFTKNLVKNDLTINTSEPKVNTGSGFSSGFRTESFF